MLQKNKKFLVLSFSFALCTLRFALNCFALNIDKVKISFLKGDYKQAIAEGERILAGGGQDRQQDELYYLLGLSYLKDGNYLRASDIFEIILSEFSGSKFKAETKLGLADTYLLRGDLNKAEGCYKELISSDASKFKAQVYYRLSQVEFKKGNLQQAKEYLDKLKQEFPVNTELKLNKDLYSLGDSPADFYYTIQIGCFSKSINAQNLMQKLIQKGYPAYIEENTSEGKTSYRVRVGKLGLQQEAIKLERKLSQEGYPTKIYP